MQPFDPPLASVVRAFPQFVNITRLAAGGQKVVYRALRRDGTAVALKLVEHRDHRPDNRTLREVQAAAKLAGPWFARIDEVTERDVAGTPCLCVTEEFIPGESLRARLHTGAQPLAFVRDLGASLLEALTHVEAAQLVHRDIKPENVMLGDGGRIVLIDFGIARHLDAASLTSDLAVVGPMSAGYCAPEQIRNEKRAISARTDLFALGVLLYEVATGSNPFVLGCTHAGEALQRCLTWVLKPLVSHGLPQGLSDFVQLCTEKAAHRRPASAAAARPLFNGIGWEPS